MADAKYAAAWRLWGALVLLGASTCFGLAAALLGVGLWHWLAWATLAAPVAAGVWFWAFPRGQRRERAAGARS